MSSGWKRHVALLAGLTAFSPLIGCEEPPPPPAQPDFQELVVLTPHNPEIREAFADGFRRWQEARKIQPPITLRWINQGTLEAQRYVHERFSQYPDSTSRGIGVDIFFGGGVAVHRDLAERGYALPIQLPESIRSAIPAELNGQPLYASDGSWHGAALGGFGILYNPRACKWRDVPAPTTWTDLAKPPYAGMIAAADPALSGSTTQCLVLIMLHQGWDEGWRIMTGLLANCNGLLPSSTHIAPNVQAGVALAGLEPEFVARMNIAGSSGQLDYVNPAGATAIIPDPITVLTGSPHRDSAVQFIEFVLSLEGQSLWALPPGTPGGPPSQALFRYPIRPDVYEKHGSQLVVKGNPFVEPIGFNIDPQVDQAYTQLLPHLVNAACGDHHVLLQRAWKKALAEGADSTSMKLLTAPPFAQTQAMTLATECARDPRRAKELQAEWAKLFADRYAQILGEKTP